LPIQKYFQKCKNNHLTLDNKQNKCPICQEDIVEKYTRIVGFYVPYSAFAQGRKEEYDQRLKYNLDNYFKSNASNINYLLKSIKFIEEPEFDIIIDQLQVVQKNAKSVINKIGYLDLKFIE
jgi:hypothetical protein